MPSSSSSSSRSSSPSARQRDSRGRSVRGRAAATAAAAAAAAERYGGASGVFESLHSGAPSTAAAAAAGSGASVSTRGGGGGGGDAQRSIEGWVLMISNLHEETPEEELNDVCAQYGEVKSLQMVLDRRTGFVKGYALVEYAQLKEAEAAVSALNGSDFLGKTISVGFAFARGELRRAGRRSSGGRRSLSPRRR